VILHNNAALHSQLSVTLMAPFSISKRRVLASVAIQKSKAKGLTQDCFIHLAHITTLDRRRIKKKIGTLEPRYYSALRNSIIDVFDLYDEMSD